MTEDKSLPEEQPSSPVYEPVSVSLTSEVTNDDEDDGLYQIPTNNVPVKEEEDKNAPDNMLYIVSFVCRQI